MKKPSIYRKTKKTSMPKNKPWAKNKGGGTVQGVIVGPKTSIGDNPTHPRVEQGNDKGGADVQTS